MDIGFFLNEKTSFIRRFYDIGSFPFLEQKRKIEAGEAPFEPPYCEDGEPPFLFQWVEADTALNVLGYSCVSMLAAALRLYLETWTKELGAPVPESLKPTFKDEGWIKGYKTHFATSTGIHFEDGPADLALIEEIVLARNRIQHAENIASQTNRYSSSDLKKLQNPFFVDNRERELFFNDEQIDKNWLILPSLHITGEKLAFAIAEIEKFTKWLEAAIALHNS